MKWTSRAEATRNASVAAAHANIDRLTIAEHKLQTWSTRANSNVRSGSIAVTTYIHLPIFLVSVAFTFALTYLLEVMALISCQTVNFLKTSILTSLHGMPKNLALKVMVLRIFTVIVRQRLFLGFFHVMRMKTAH